MSDQGLDGGPDSRWVGILDEMESRLAQHREALLGRAEVPAPVEIPIDIEQMPGDLRRRAESVLALTKAVEEMVTQSKLVIGSALSVSATVATEPVVPVYLDTPT